MRPTRLTSTTRASTTLQVAYNGLNGRVRQTVGATTTSFILDSAGGLPEVISTTRGTTYLHLPGVIMAQNSSGQRVYLLPDGLGSIRQVMSGTNVVAQRDFDPYGNPISTPSVSTPPYAFTGEWWEQDAQLLHLRARWYAPGEGIFLSKDAWAGDEARSQSMNGWSYVEGNPVNRTDPGGHCIVQWSGEVRMNQAPYGTSGLCPHTESAHTEAAYAATAMHNDPGNDPPFPTKEMYREYISSLLPESWRDEYNTLTYCADIVEPWISIGMMADVGGLGSNPVTLYRAIDQSELDDILQFGDYGLSPHGGGKYFALTKKGVVDFSNSSFNAGRNMTITKIEVPKSFLDDAFNSGNAYYFDDVGGAGESIHFSEEILPDLYRIASIPKIVDIPWLSKLFK